MIDTNKMLEYVTDMESTNRTPCYIDTQEFKQLLIELKSAEEIIKSVEDMQNNLASWFLHPEGRNYLHACFLEQRKALFKYRAMRQLYEPNENK
tara:strand:+ start:1466 stop:1747 length:282 start_codon:yes stop_codon:yes gene_type:complete